MAIEFICRDCGQSVFAYALAKPPEHGRCIACQFVSDIDDPTERVALRDQLARFWQTTEHSQMLIVLLLNQTATPHHMVNL
jgi:hypothetical protein